MAKPAVRCCLFCTAPSSGTAARSGRTALQAQGWRQGEGSCLPGWPRALGMERGVGNATRCSSSFSGGRQGQDGQPAPSHLPPHRRHASTHQLSDADSSYFEQPLRQQSEKSIPRARISLSSVLERFEATQAHAVGCHRSALAELYLCKEPSHGPCKGDPSHHKCRTLPWHSSAPHSSVLAYLGI